MACPRCRLALAALAITLALAAVPVGATGPAQTNRELAAQLYTMGMTSIQNKEYAEAARAFERAFMLDPSPTLMFNAARAHDLGGNVPLAVLRYRELLSQQGATPEQRLEAKRRIAELEVNPESRVAVGAQPLTALAPGGAGVAQRDGAVTGSQGGVAPTAAGGGIPSDKIVFNAIRDGERPYALSAIQCYWNGSLNRFQSCSTTHSWGGMANVDLTPGRTNATGNALLIGFKAPYYRRPMCHVEFQDIIAHRRVDARETGVYVHLHDIQGNELAWSQVSTWVTMVCHGVR